MKKKTDDELGILLTREMQSMMLNEKLTAEQRITMFKSIVTSEELTDPLLQSFAESIKSGYEYANKMRVRQIYNRRERQRKTYKDERTSTEINVDEHSSPIKGNGNGNGNGNISPNPQGGKGEPSPISPEDLIGGASPDERTADEIKKSILEWYPHEVNERKLRKSIVTALKNFPARVIAEGIEKWRASGAWNEAGWIPQNIGQWIRDGKFKSEPPMKNFPTRAESSVPDADATRAILEDDGE